MTSTAQDAPIYNLSGTLIFSAYVISALLLSFYIIRDLVSLYQKNVSAASAKRTKGPEKRLQIFAALSVLSFSTLSYHMLSYLIISYHGWAEVNGIALPRKLLGGGGLFGNTNERVELHVWRWLTSSTLFQDFAEIICGTNARFWWTQQALLVTMGWSVFMSFEGRKRKIPILWAYALISQILPVSFAQNLFFLAVVLKRVPNPSEKIWTPTPVLQLLPLLGYYLFVLIAPHVAGTAVFVGVIIVVRLLLFAPLILPSVVPEGGGTSYLTPRKAHWMDASPFYFIAICSAMLWVLQSLLVLREVGLRPSKIIGALNDSPAVSALGYDYVLSLLSIGVWALRLGGDGD